MTSSKQIKANRRNARKSTGPKTPEGKAMVRFNAMKHGLLSREILLPEENARELTALAERLRVELQPVGELENVLVERIIAAVWRLRRLVQVESGIFARRLYLIQVDRAQYDAEVCCQDHLVTAREVLRFLQDEYFKAIRRIIDERNRRLESPPPIEETTEKLRILKEKAKLGTLSESDIMDLDALEQQLTLERANMREAVEHLSRGEEALTQLRMQAPTLGRAFVEAETSDALSKLSRYETTIERGLYRAIHELQRLQAARRGGSASPPVAIDVDLITSGETS